MSESARARTVAGAVRVAAATIALLLLLECSARLVIFGAAGLDPRRVGLLRDLDPADLVRYETEPGLFLVKLIQSRLGLGRPSFAAPPLAPPPPVPETQQVVAKLGEISRERGLPVVVVRLEYDPRSPTALERALEARVLEEGMFYLDTRAAFRGTRPQEFWIHELDPHPNRRAHALFADVLEEFLRSRGLFGGSRPPALSAARPR
jgi:hypothetical protein